MVKATKWKNNATMGTEKQANNAHTTIANDHSYKDWQMTNVGEYPQDISW